MAWCKRLRFASPKCFAFRKVENGGETRPRLTMGVKKNGTEVNSYHWGGNRRAVSRVLWPDELSGSGPPHLQLACDSVRLFERLNHFAKLAGIARNSSLRL